MFENNKKTKSLKDNGIMKKIYNILIRIKNNNKNNGYDDNVQMYITRDGGKYSHELYFDEFMAGDTLIDEKLKRIIEGEKRGLEELEEDMEWRRKEIGEAWGRYKIISGKKEEIIKEIKEIFLLKEII
jgi:hypothetical protein